MARFLLKIFLSLTTPLAFLEWYAPILLRQRITDSFQDIGCYEVKWAYRHDAVSALMVGLIILLFSFIHFIPYRHSGVYLI